MWWEINPLWGLTWTSSNLLKIILKYQTSFPRTKIVYFFQKNVDIYGFRANQTTKGKLWKLVSKYPDFSKENFVIWNFCRSKKSKSLKFWSIKSQRFFFRLTSNFFFNNRKCKLNRFFTHSRHFRTFQNMSLKKCMKKVHFFF